MQSVTNGKTCYHRFFFLSFALANDRGTVLLPLELNQIYATKSTVLVITESIFFYKYFMFQAMGILASHVATPLLFQFIKK